MAKILIIAFLCVRGIGGQSLTASRGWFDIQKPDPRERLVAVGSAGDRLVISIAHPGAAQVIVYNPDLTEMARWPVTKPPKFLSGNSEWISLWNQSDDSHYTVCRYSPVGKLLSPCRDGVGWASAVVDIGGKTVAVTEEGSMEIAHSSGQPNPSLTRLSNASGEGPFLAVASGSILYRIDGTSLAAFAVDTVTGEERPLVLSSPTLIKNQQSRGRAVLASHAFSSGDGGFWLAHGKYNVFTGLTLDKFSKEGSFLRTIVLQVPQFAELKRSTNQSNFGNPTGHLDTRVMVSVGDRLVIVDSAALRVAWFEGLEFQREQGN